MESTVCTISKTLASTSNPFFFTSSFHRCFPKAFVSQCFHSRLTSPNFSSPSLRASPAFHLPLYCFSISTVSSAIGGGGDDPTREFRDDANPKATVSEEVVDFSPNVIILDVGGMTCGECATSVKRILESQEKACLESEKYKEDLFILLKEQMLNEHW